MHQNLGIYPRKGDKSKSMATFYWDIAKILKYIPLKWAFISSSRLNSKSIVVKDLYLILWEECSSGENAVADSSVNINIEGQFGNLCQKDLNFCL